MRPRGLKADRKQLSSKQRVVGSNPPRDAIQAALLPIHCNFASSVILSGLNVLIEHHKTAAMSPGNLVLHPSNQIMTGFYRFPWRLAKLAKTMQGWDF